MLSLIVCSLGRREPIVRLLTSMSRQTSQDFEIVLIDQNPLGYLDEQVAPFGTGTHITRISSPIGLSRGRNIGLRHVSGEIVGFPDDDSWYDEGVVATVLRIFEAEHDLTLLTGRTCDEHGTESLARHLESDAVITRDNVFLIGTSNTLFVRREAAFAVGGFDERLGVGSGTPLRSGEETDFILRCLKRGYSGQYRSSLVVRHPQTSGTPEILIQRARSYSVGFGHLLRTHHYRFSFLAGGILRALGRAALCACRGDGLGARTRFAWVAGALRGYRLVPEGTEE